MQVADQRLMVTEGEGAWWLAVANDHAGNADSAHQRVVDLWRNGEPEFQAQAREVQTRIDKLRPPS
jgi:hypothetical protein